MGERQNFTTAVCFFMAWISFQRLTPIIHHHHHHQPTTIDHGQEQQEEVRNHQPNCKVC